jgi:AmmeMemoRadiSam system protein A
LSLLADTERGALLALARRAIAARLAGAPAPALPPGEALRAQRGAFVSLHRRGDGSLRGCVGFVEPLFPLAEAVARAAVAAATGDPRFAPVTAGELAALRIDVSVLGPTHAIRPEAVEVGVHGLVLRHRGCSGLLLPQVPVEHGWDRTAFLDHVCLKAGLGAGAWREAGAELLAFGAEVFRED